MVRFGSPRLLDAVLHASWYQNHGIPKLAESEVEVAAEPRRKAAMDLSVFNSAGSKQSKIKQGKSKVAAPPSTAPKKKGRGKGFAKLSRKLMKQRQAASAASTKTKSAKAVSPKPGPHPGSDPRCLGVNHRFIWKVIGKNGYCKRGCGTKVEFKPRKMGFGMLQEYISKNGIRSHRKPPCVGQQSKPKSRVK